MPAGRGHGLQRADWPWPIRLIRPRWTNWLTSSARRSSRWWPTRRTSRRPVSRYYGDSQSSVADILKELGQDNEIAREAAEAAASGAIDDLANLANETPIIRFVNLVLFQAVQDRASDIHFEPFEDEFKIRYRVDGALYEMSPPPKHLALPVISRLKVMSGLDISERRLPQDGRISLQVAGPQHRLARLHPARPSSASRSSCACWIGRRSIWTSRPSVFPRAFLITWSEAIQQPNGIFVVTGPTGSRQNDHALFLPAQHQHHRLQTADRGRPGGIRHRRHHAGGGQ